MSGCFSKNIALSILIVIFPVICIFLDFNYYSNLFEPLFSIDDSSLVEIPQLRSNLNFEFLKTLFMPGNHVDFYPVRDLSYWVDIKFLNANFASAVIFKITNILFYLLILIALSSFIYQIINNFQIASLLTLFWGLNPFHNETIFWISARKDLVFLVFFIISANLFFLDYKSQHKYKYFILANFSLILAHFSKASAIVCSIIYSCLFLYQYRKSYQKIYLYKFIILFSISFFFLYINFINYSKFNSMYFEYSSLYRFGAVMAAFGKVFLGFFVFIFNSIESENWSNWLELNMFFVYVGILVVFCIFFLSISLIRENKNYIYAIAFFLGSLIAIPGINKLHRSFYSTRYYELPILIIFLVLIYYFKKKLLNSFKTKVIIIFCCIYYFICLKIDGYFWKDNISIASKGLILSPDNISLKRVYISEYLNLVNWGKQSPEQTNTFNRYMKDSFDYCYHLSSLNVDDNNNGNLCLNFWSESYFNEPIFLKYKVVRNTSNVLNVKDPLAISINYYQMLTGLNREKLELNYINPASLLNMKTLDLKNFLTRYENMINSTTENSRYIRLIGYCLFDKSSFDILFESLNIRGLISKQGYYKITSTFNLDSKNKVRSCFKDKKFNIN